MARHNFLITMIVFSVVAEILCSCQRITAPSQALFKHAENLVLEQKFDAAVPVLKSFLLQHPEHSGAHYYLGRCFFASKKKYWFAIAVGEIETALALYHRDGNHSTIARFPDRFFPEICYMDLCKIQMKQFVFLTEHHASREALMTCLQDTHFYLEKAHKLDGGKGMPKEMFETFNMMCKILGLSPAYPQFSSTKTMKIPKAENHFTHNMK